ncbi:MAG: sigma-70 family RNA polymerase sigma factor [Streptosporangiaceae bacterium]
MNEGDWLATRFEQQRAHLRAVAYRMLGSSVEADDAVQETWLRLDRSDTSGVDNLGGWLTTVAARVCLDMLRSRASRREEPLTAHEPEPTSNSGDRIDPENEAVVADSIGPALMVVLDALAPAERLAFVLHDVFAMPFDEIAPILERSPAATRKLASRARRRVRGATPPTQADLARQRKVVDAFLVALREGDFDALLAVLHPDVRLRDDSLAQRPDTATPLHGARSVAAHAASYSWGARFAQPALVNGAVGLALVRRGEIIGALGFTYKHDKITEIEVVGDPQRLQHVDLAAPNGRMT